MSGSKLTNTAQQGANMRNWKDPNATNPAWHVDDCDEDGKLAFPLEIAEVEVYHSDDGPDDAEPDALAYMLYDPRYQDGGGESPALKLDSLSEAMDRADGWWQEIRRAEGAGANPHGERYILIDPDPDPAAPVRA